MRRGDVGDDKNLGRRLRSGAGGSKTEEERRPGNGGMTPLGNSSTRPQVEAGRGEEWFE